MTPMNPRLFPHLQSRLARQGFTLVELLVAMAVLSLILTLVVDIVSRTQNAIGQAKERAESFQEARAAFDTLTSTMSRASMDATWGYHMGTNVNNSYFKRESDLHFVLGPNSNLLPDNQEVSQAIFFQAPLGFSGNVTNPNGGDSVSDQLNYADEILNCWGYYISYGSDLEQRPDFLAQGSAVLINPERKRFRLMEFRLPAEQSKLYSMELSSADQQSSRGWFLGPFQDGTTLADHSTPVAENVLAMILIPHSITHASKTVGDTTSEFTPEPDYSYNSRQFQWDAANAKAKRTRHQLPGMIQAILIVSDEASYQRFENSMSTPDAAAEDIRNVFRGKFQNYAQHEAEMLAVEAALNQRKLNYKVFSSAVAMRGAKWITDYEL